MTTDPTLAGTTPAPAAGTADDTTAATPDQVVTMTREEFDQAVDEAVSTALDERAPLSAVDDSAPVRYAVYDTTLARYVGDVVDTTKAARAIAKDRGLAAGKFDVREV